MKNTKKIMIIAIVFILLFGVMMLLNSKEKHNKDSKEKATTSVQQEESINESESEEFSEYKNTDEETSEVITEEDTENNTETATDKTTESTNGNNGNAQDSEFEDPKEPITVIVHDDLVEPGKEKLNIDSIAGFIPDREYDGNNKNPKPGTTEKETKKTNNGIKLSVENITADAVGGYTGNYVEDGSDEPVVNVASLVVTNHSNLMLQVADIEFKVNDNDVAKFRVTNLLPGASVLVLEASKREYNKKDNYSYGTVATAWIESVSLQEDKFTITKEDGLLTLKNNTDKAYEKVYVYYKYIQVGGAYMGGITYRVPFTNVAPNAKIESVANHFNKGTSRIFDVQIVE